MYNKYIVTKLDTQWCIFDTSKSIFYFAHKDENKYSQDDLVRICNEWNGVK